MRLTTAALSLAILLGASNVKAAQGVHSYGWFDVGGLIAVPADRSSNQYGAGFAFSSGVQFLSYMQAGGRFRFVVISERTCSPAPAGRFSCGRGWSAEAGSLGLELRLRFPVSPGVALALGGSLGLGFWSNNGTDTFGGGGTNLAADLRLVYLLGRRVGVHVSFEQQEQFGMERDGGRLNLSTFWAGLDW